MFTQITTISKCHSAQTGVSNSPTIFAVSLQSLFLLPGNCMLFKCHWVTEEGGKINEADQT